MYDKYMKQYFKTYGWGDSSKTEKSIDNSNTPRYNEDSKTTSYDLNDAWKKSNEKELRYAGDSAKESVDKGLDYVPKFMKDAPEDTDYGKVQTAAVKWSLANDTDNKELKQSAFDELTGLLSTENKEQYLKKARPLQEFVDAKDTFDYKRNNYTTTKNMNKEFCVTTYDLQQFLNSEGYTDKFGNPLKEDGIMGAKTQYAYDQMLAAETAKNSDSASTEQPTAQVKAVEPTKIQTADTETANYNKEAFERNSSETLPSRSSFTSRTQMTQPSEIYIKSIKTYDDKTFDYNTRLSYNQTYDKKVEILQNRLVELGYLDMSAGGWGYYGPKTIDAVNRYKKDKGLGNTGKDAGVVGKDTWSSLGLLYRTEKDINAGVKIVTVGTHQYFDLTYAVIRAVSKAWSEFESHKNDRIDKKYSWFKNTVGNYGKWNIKRNLDVWESTLGISSNSFNQKFYFMGNLIGREALGNITYGYLGKIAGFSDFELLAGSLYNDITTHGTGNSKNEKGDQAFIRKGINWFNDKDIGAKLYEN